VLAVARLLSGEVPGDQQGQPEYGSLGDDARAGDAG